MGYGLYSEAISRELRPFQNAVDWVNANDQQFSSCTLQCAVGFGAAKATSAAIDHQVGRALDCAAQDRTQHKGPLLGSRKAASAASRVLPVMSRATGVGTAIIAAGCVVTCAGS